MRPLLKWVGGKTKIINQVIDSFPKKVRNYYEPFLGGGSVLMALLLSNIEIEGKIIASNCNPHLIDFFKMVRDDPGSLFSDLDVLVKDPKNDTPESYYYFIRDTFSTSPSPALFPFLNRTCF
jgi:DNA adenine methylase